MEARAVIAAAPSFDGCQKHLQGKILQHMYFIQSKLSRIIHLNSLKVTYVSFLKFRFPDHTLNCVCDEKCFKKKKILCKNKPIQKKICKYCRYKKCQTDGGMEAKYVFKYNELAVANRYTRKKDRKNTEKKEEKEKIKRQIQREREKINEKERTKERKRERCYVNKYISPEQRRAGPASPGKLCSSPHR